MVMEVAAVGVEKSVLDAGALISSADASSTGVTVADVSNDPDVSNDAVGGM